ncbi:MAG: hypothetical protein OXF50_21220 [Caldilineaceae bacterium]|nr:hypothetical protein [Caldilineaceae bacterium]
MSSENGIRVMIFDNHAIVREGIAKVLGHSGEFEVVGQAGAAFLQVTELRRWPSRS